MGILIIWLLTHNSTTGYSNNQLLHQLTHVGSYWLILVDNNQLVLKMIWLILDNMVSLSNIYTDLVFLKAWSITQ